MPQPLPGTVPSVRLPFFGVRPSAEVAPIAQFELHPSITLTEDYTDNFDLSARHKRDNLRTIVTPGLTLLINKAFLKGSLSTGMSETYDTRTDSFETFCCSLTGQLSWQATPRWLLTAYDSLTRTDQAAAADQLGIRQQRHVFLSNNFGVSSRLALDIFATEQHYSMSVFWDEGRATTITHTMGTSVSARFLELMTGTLGYNHLISTTSAGASDVTGDQFFASVARQLSRVASAGVSGTYALNHASGNDLPSNDFRIWTVSLFSTYNLPGRWSILANVGYTRLVPDRGEERGGLYTLSSLTYQFARAVASLTVDRGFSPSYALGQNAGVVDTFGVTAVFTMPLAFITPRLTGAATGFYRESSFTGVASTQTGNTTTWGGTAALTMALLRWLNSSLEYSYRVFTPTGTGGSRSDVVENRVRLTLSAGF